MEELIIGVMENPDEARALFDILDQLIGEAEGERFENLIAGVGILEADVVRVALAMLLSVTPPEVVDRARANFMRDIHPTPTSSAK